MPFVTAVTDSTITWQQMVQQSNSETKTYTVAFGAPTVYSYTVTDGDSTPTLALTGGGISLSGLPYQAAEYTLTGE